MSFLSSNFKNSFIFVFFKRPDDINNILSSKIALKYAGREVESMKAIGAASQKRSLADFKAALETYKAELIDDTFVRSHLDTLYDNLLEQNLCRIIEPFSKVQIAHVAGLIKLPKVRNNKTFGVI